MPLRLEYEPRDVIVLFVFLDAGRLFFGLSFISGSLVKGSYNLRNGKANADAGHHGF
jgi:hypothetical protein